MNSDKMIANELTSDFDNNKNTKPPLFLALPRNISLEEAKYWLNVAHRHCPGREIIPKIK